MEQMNRTELSVNHANAFTNNTFSLKETELSIRDAMENSFKYLKELQKSYISISRFNKTEEDLYIDYDNRICITLDKEFVESTKRKAYRTSEFYNQLISVDSINGNPDIFSYTPVVFIDGGFVYSYYVKSSLDGTVELVFNHITEPHNYLKEAHNIEVVFVKNAWYQKFVTNKYVLEKYGWELPLSVTGISKPKSGVSFMFLKGSKDATAGNIHPTMITDDRFIILQNDLNLYDIFYNNPEVEITVLHIDDMYELPELKQICRRLDTQRLTSTVVISPSEGMRYAMPIPTENLFIVRRNKLTGVYTYENNKDITLHYPNIYEIFSDELSFDEYEYKVYYFYREINRTLYYKNHFEYIHRYIAQKLNTTMEYAVNRILYDETVDSYIRDYFLSIFNYEDPDYIYNHGDFFNSLKPYDFDYKVAKMNEFIEKDPFILESYGKKVSTMFDRYFMEVKNVDLTKRVRNNTYQETDDLTEFIEFEEPYYVFVFRNETNNYLDLRFFIDGILCTHVYQVQGKDTEYVYLPVSCVNGDSYIEVEDFHSYMYTKRLVFDDITEEQTIEFDNVINIEPTLFDLFITTEDRVRLNRADFKIYCMIDRDIYDVSDVIETSAGDTASLILNDIVMEDPETGELYIDIDDIFIDENSILMDDEYIEASADALYRLPLKHMRLKKLKIKCTNEEYLDIPLLFIVNKVPYMTHKDIENDGLLSVKIFNGKLAWAEHPSYVRTFINGRFVPLDFELHENDDHACIFVSKCFMTSGDRVTVDVSPYSYDLEYHEAEISDDFVISFNGSLSKPFSLYYYDIYLNGRKLSDKNIDVLTADKIKLFNVHSRKNLYIYRRDRDIEFYGMTNPIYMPLDDFLNSSLIPDSDKYDIIDYIINHKYPDMNINPGTDTETDINISHGQSIAPEMFDRYVFYSNVIIPQGVAQPNTFLIDITKLTSMYQNVYSDYGNGDRIVIQPNISYDADTVLMVGKNAE